MEKRKPIPKSQVQISQDSIEPYLNQGKAPVPSHLRRENQRTVKDSDVKQFSVGLQDVDGAIIYYFNNVIKPSVIQNGVKINVPVMYGSPERWAAVQKEGFVRDKNGKIQTPLIMFKRDSIEKNRNLSNKMDANVPIHFGVFEKRYSSKNVYDRFSTLGNREPVKEYYGVIVPDHVNLVYSCTVFTEYVEQMNKIVESINYASDSYWGDPSRFQFRAAIDSYTTTTELSQGTDRTVKTTFQIKMAGYIISDAVNTSVGNTNRFFSKSAIRFGMDAVTSIPSTNEIQRPLQKAGAVRFYDQLPGSNVTISQGASMTAEQIAYVTLNTAAVADVTMSGNVATFTGQTIATPPAGFTLDKNSFSVYVNSTFIPNIHWDLLQVGSNIEVTFNPATLGYTVVDSDEIVIVGKFF